MDFYIGYPPRGLPLGRSTSTRLVTIRSADLAFTQFISTVQQMMNKLNEPNVVINGPEGAASDVFQMTKAVKDILRGRVVVLTNGPDTWTYNEYFEGRAYQLHLESNKKRKRGVFVPGAKRSQNRNAQFMRIRVPHG